MIASNNIPELIEGNRNYMLLEEIYPQEIVNGGHLSRFIGFNEDASIIHTWLVRQ